MITDDTSVPAAPVLNDAVLAALGQKMTKDFTQYEADRRIAELRWMRNLRQFLGVYDPDIEKQLDPNRSQAYPKLTRVKCVSMLSRMMNLLFPSSERNWSIEPSKVPNLEAEDLADILMQLQQPDPQTGQKAMPTDDQIEAAIRDFASLRAANLTTEIEDQLDEIGGDRMVDYVALCRKVLMSGITYGIGILKGPFAKTQSQRRWQRNPDGSITPIIVDALRPQFESITVWDYYPDMSAKFLHQMDGQFTRMVMSRRQIRELADRNDFLKGAIHKYLRDNTTGNYTRRTYETELKTLGVQINVVDTAGRKYEVIAWDGFVSGAYLRAAGVEVDDAKLNDMVEAVVWILGSTVIKATMSPWSMLGTDVRVNSFHHFVFEEDDSSILGNGLPNIMRDSQMGVSATTRMIMDNGSVVCGPITEVNTDLMRLDQDLSSVHAHKVFYREGTGQDAQYPAIKSINIDSHITELLQISNMFQGFADTETFINPATGGDMQKGPSEPFRTAAGASMIRGDAALPFKDVVRNFDLFTQSVFASLVAFNKHFNTRPEIQGDFQVVTHGSTSLIAKETRGMAYDNLVNTLRPEEQIYINWYELAKDRMTTRDVDIGRVLCSAGDAKTREASRDEAAQKQAMQQEELMRAEIREMLASAVKQLTQSDKNSALADATTYNTILKGLEKDVTPTQVANARAGIGAPQGAVQQPVQPNGAGASGAAEPRAGNMQEQPSVGQGGGPSEDTGGS